MDSTSVSLLQRLRSSDAEQAWERFVGLYTPLMDYWVRKIGVPTSDAPDLVQNVFATLVKELPKFQYNRGKSFRGWLRTVTLNTARDYFRRNASRPQQTSDRLAETVAAADEVEFLDEAEYRAHLVGCALNLMRSEFQETHWQACWQHVTEGRAADEVAAELGITTNVVYLAKSRILRRLREELAGMLE
jgi:RNA polymerase sigma-70 factor (ECF subfamily)